MTTRLLIIVLFFALPTTASAQQADWESAEATGGDDAVAGPNEDVWGDPNEQEEEDDEDDDDDAEDDDDDADDDDEPLVDIETEETGLAGSIQLWGELAMWGGEFDHDQLATLDAFLLSPVIGGAYFITDFIRVGAQTGIALLLHGDLAGAMVMEDGGVAFRFGNPLLFGELLGVAGDFQYRVGVGVTLPLAGPGSSLAEGATLSLASGMRGGWDLWLWAPRRLSIVGEGRLDYAPLEELTLSGEVGLAPMFFLGDGSGETLLAFQFAVGAEYALSEVVQLGGRFTGVLAEDALPERKSFQLAFEPYAKFDFGPGHIRAALVLNITPPYGFSFIEGNPWGFSLGFETLL